MLLVLGLGAWAAYRSVRVASFWAYAGALVAAVAVPWTGGSESPLLPYLLAPGLTLGLTRGARELFLCAGGVAVALVLGTVPPGADTGEDYFVVSAEWVLLATALGLVATWARHLAGSPPERDAYLEVRRLLEQLRARTSSLPGGLDAPSAAEALLERCAKVVSHTRSAVMARPTGSAFVPLAVRGARRVPWRAPLDQDGPLRRAWESGRPVLDQRQPDRVGRRQGSALLAVPLMASDGPYGLVILESHELDAFTPVRIDELELLVTASAAQLEAALLFEEVRMQASTEERDRLAREMHDGIGQELAFLGYRLDDLRYRAAAVSPELAASVSELRADLTTLISDLRLSITDLRTTVRPDRSLGAALSTYLHAVCSGKGVVLNLSLSETAFRLPAEQEIALFKAAQAFAQDVRRAPDATGLTVRLSVDPPSALLHLSADGVMTEVDLGDMHHVLARLGADVTASRGSDGGPVLEIELRGGADDDQRPAGRRPRVDQAGPAASVRAD